MTSTVLKDDQTDQELKDFESSSHDNESQQWQPSQTLAMLKARHPTSVKAGPKSPGFAIYMPNFGAAGPQRLDFSPSGPPNPLMESCVASAVIGCVAGEFSMSSVSFQMAIITNELFRKFVTTNILQVLLWVLRCLY